MDPDSSNVGPGHPAQIPERVELKVFPDVNSAELAKANLLARGIKCWLTADDCGGMYSFLDVVHGVKLFVRQSDRDAAMTLLTAHPVATNDLPPDETTASTPAPPTAPPRIKLSLPQLTTGIVIGILLCLLYQWTAKFGTKTHRYDSNGDGKPDEVWVYRDGRLVESSFDRNFDGKFDWWHHFDSTGARILVKADDNFDGKPDGTWYFTNGVTASSRLDTDFNGIPDVTYTFEHELPVQADWQPNGTNIVTLRQFFRHGRLVEEWRDTNADGTFDISIPFDAFENPVETKAFKLRSLFPK